MRTLLLALAGAALLAVGVAVLATGHDTDFGWFAYTPLDSGTTDFGSGLVVLSTGRFVTGAAVAALGLVTLAGVVGYRAGRAVRRNEPA